MKNKLIIILGIIFLFMLSEVLANNPPVLRDGGVNPEWATPGTTLVYSVIYTDIDGDIPSYVRIYFSDGSKEMEKVSGNYKTGAKYQYVQTATVEKSGINFYFEASDGHTTARLPTYEGGTYASTNIISETGILENNKIYLFSNDSNQPIWSFETGPDWVHAVAISSDGKHIVVKTTDYIYFFSRENNKPLWKYQCMSELGRNKEHFAGWVSISSDGNYIVGGCQDSLNLFSKEGNKLWSYPTRVYTTSISVTGDYIALGTLASPNKNGEVILFSKESNRPSWQYEAKSDVHGLAISGDGNYIATGAHCPDRGAYIFSRQSNKPLLGRVMSEDSPVWTADISFDGKYAVYGLDGGDGFNNIFIFSVDKNEFLRKYAVEGWVRSVAMSEDGKYIVAGSGVGRSVYLFDKDSDKPIWKFKAGERVGSVSISSDGSYIVAGSKDKNIYFFSKGNSEPLWKYNTGVWLNSVAISSDGKYIVAGTGASQYLSEGHQTPIQESQLGQQPSQPEKPAVCGDTICEGEKGETYENCPKDCVIKEGEGVQKTKEEIEKKEKKPRFILPIILIIIAGFVIFFLIKRKKKCNI